MTSQSYVIELVELCRMTQNQRDWTRFDKVMPLSSPNGVGDLCVVQFSGVCIWVKSCRIFCFGVI